MAATTKTAISMNTNIKTSTTKDDVDMDEDEDEQTIEIESEVVKAMLDACTTGNTELIQKIISEKGTIYVCQQDYETGISPLMVAAGSGHGSICNYLLEQGAPWNAIDRNGQCAGNFATNQQHWHIVNLLVEWGTRAELILGMIERSRRDNNSNNTYNEQQQQQKQTTTSTNNNDIIIPVEHEPCTKPDYLRQRVQYTADGQSLLDSDNDAIMMEWERPLMYAHAQILMNNNNNNNGNNNNGNNNNNNIIGKRVLNIGFGMGIIDTAIQEYNPIHHIIIEAHPDICKRMIETGWDTKSNVRICYGKWQDIIPKLIQEGVILDAIFYDTYGEHFLDLEDFHTMMVQILAKPNGIYSFFNGLAPDNIFFHGVACQCIKLQLSHLGIDSEFVPCEIQVKDEVWEGIRRKYWHGRDTYYLPVCTWNTEYLTTGKTRILDPVVEEARQKRKAENDNNNNMNLEAKRRQQQL